MCFSRSLFWVSNDDPPLQPTLLLLQGKLHLLSAVNVVTDGVSCSLSLTLSLPLSLPLYRASPPTFLLLLLLPEHPSLLSHRSLAPLALAASCPFAASPLSSLRLSSSSLTHTHTHTHTDLHAHTCMHVYTLSPLSLSPLSLSLSFSQLHSVGPVQTWGAPERRRCWCWFCWSFSGDFSYSSVKKTRLRAMLMQQHPCPLRCVHLPASCLESARFGGI